MKFVQIADSQLKWYFNVYLITGKIQYQNRRYYCNYIAISVLASESPCMMVAVAGVLGTYSQLVSGLVTKTMKDEGWIYDLSKSLQLMGQGSAELLQLKAVKMNPYKIFLKVFALSHECNKCMLITTEQHLCSHPHGSNFSNFLCQDNNNNGYNEDLDTLSIKGMQEL